MYKRLAINSIVIYDQQPYYICGYKLDPAFYVIYSLYTIEESTVHVTELISTSLTKRELIKLGITTTAQFQSQFPEYFI